MIEFTISHQLKLLGQLKFKKRSMMIPKHELKENKSGIFQKLKDRIIRT
jgi:hypothetical protein